MKILHIVDESYDSGIVQYALKAASGLREHGLDCQLWGTEGGFPIREAQRLGVPASGYTHPWLNLGALRRRVREEGFDSVVAHTGSAHTLAVALAAWHGTNIPVIRTRGDARPLKPRPGRRLIWKRTAGFIAVNQRILDQYRRLYPALKIPAAMIYEGSGDPGPMRPPLAGAPTVGIVARLDPIKGHSVFLEAAAIVLRKHPDARFLIIGRQENIRSADLLREAERLKIGRQVELTGHVPRVVDYMRRCHVGVVASLGSEAVSRAAVEWMSVGRPLVATSVGCLPEYVEEGKTGHIVAPRDPEALAERIGRLVGDVYLRERMGREGRRRYEERFTLARFIEDTRTFYEKALHAVPS